MAIIFHDSISWQTLKINKIDKHKLMYGKKSQITIAGTKLAGSTLLRLYEFVQLLDSELSK